MFAFHDSALIQREVGTWAAQRDCRTAEDYREDMRDYFAGYCLDAPDRSPAGSSWRVEPRPCDRYTLDPFGATSYSWYRP